ncbi:MAG: hypothetical protein P4L53_03335 [Candidatus Obscuribacterales bacterium]|nr:hypothetical protein [Candidatus Obscuribacterales bacterium]
MSQVDEQNLNPATGREWDVDSLLRRVVELQEQLLQAQEKSVVLSAQARELDRVARDADDLKAELTAQGLLLSDKSRENKHLHQELSRVTTVLDVKLNEVEELRAGYTEIQAQLKMREQERDLLALMLNEAENAAKRAEADAIAAMEQDARNKNAGAWPFGKNPKKT